MSGALLRAVPPYRARWIGGCGLAIAILSGIACGGGDPVTANPEDDSVTISGGVTAADGSPVPGASVALEALAMTTVTDDAGRFSFTIASAGEGISHYVVEVRGEGFRTASLHVVVAPGGTARLDVTLQSIPTDADPDPEPELSGIVVTSYSEDAVLCIAPGVELSYTVRIANEGASPVEGIVLHDTLGTEFARNLSPPDIAVDRSAFPEAEVVLNPDGRSFRIQLGSVPPMEAAEVYTVTLPATVGGVYCNRVSAVGANGHTLSSDIGCLTNTLALEIDLVNEDGAIVGGVFTPDPEVFRVGDGSSDRPDGLVYRVAVANHHCGSLGFPMGDSSLVSRVGARSGSVAFREVLPGYPSRGSIASSSAGGFVWSIGTLAPGEEAEVRFRAEAIQAGDDVHRTELTVPQLTGTLVDEQPITILP
jgi:hypothetical protein